MSTGSRRRPMRRTQGQHRGAGRATESEALSGEVGEAKIHSEGGWQREAVRDTGVRGQTDSAGLCEAVECDLRAGVLECSYSYRPERSALDGVRDLTFDLQYGVYGYVVEADVKGFFDHMDHDWLLKMLSLRIDDQAFLDLIRKWLKAGILETDGEVIHPDTGTPQGEIVSPVSQMCTYISIGLVV